MRSDDSRARMEEAVEILDRLWRGGPLTYSGKYFHLQVPDLRPRPVQLPGPPLWRSVISQSSFTECGRLGIPILTARLPVARIKERWALYEAGLETGGHDDITRSRLLAQCALWRNVYVAESDAQAEDELSVLLLRTRAHMMHARAAHNPPDFEIDPVNLNAWTNPTVGDAEAIAYILETGSLFLTRPRTRAGRGTARCRCSPLAVPDRVRRYEPRLQPRFDASLRRRGDASISVTRLKRRRGILELSRVDALDPACQVPASSRSAAVGTAASHFRRATCVVRWRSGPAVRRSAAPPRATRYRRAANPTRTATCLRRADQRRIQATAPSCRYRGNSGPRPKHRAACA